MQKTKYSPNQNTGKAMIVGPQKDFFNSSFTKIELDGGLKLPLPIGEPSEAVRSVCFSERSGVFEIPHINDLSDEEINAVWMSDADFKAIREECRKIIEAIERGFLNILVGIELRGLEHHLSIQRNQKAAMREILYDTVEKLQCYEDQTQIDVSDLIGEMCRKVSKQSVQKAHQMALRDGVEAKS